MPNFFQDFKSGLWEDWAGMRGELLFWVSKRPLRLAQAIRNLCTRQSVKEKSYGGMETPQSELLELLQRRLSSGICFRWKYECLRSQVIILPNSPPMRATVFYHYSKSCLTPIMCSAKNLWQRYYKEIQWIYKREKEIIKWFEEKGKPQIQNETPYFCLQMTNKMCALKNIQRKSPKIIGGKNACGVLGKQEPLWGLSISYLTYIM